MAKKVPGIGINIVDQAQPAPLSTELPETKSFRQGKQPFCLEHGLQMVAYCTSEFFTYYRCPKERCKEREKLRRPVGPFKDRYGFGKSAQNAEASDVGASEPLPKVKGKAKRRAPMIGREEGYPGAYINGGATESVHRPIRNYNAVPAAGRFVQDASEPINADRLVKDAIDAGLSPPANFENSSD